MSLVENALQKAKQASKQPVAPQTQAAVDGASSLESGEAGRAARVAQRKLPRGTPITLDVEELRKLGLMPEASEERRQLEQYRFIKRQLLKPAAVPDAESSALRSENLMMVASALPNEGKTYTAFNLALTIARGRDFAVLLVDADPAMHRLTDVLQLRDRRGLMDLLHDPELLLEDVIVPTNVPRFAVIPAGPTDETATELLASQRMVKIADELRDRYADHIVLFDSGPLTLTSEAPVLASVVDRVVMVVSAGVTLRHSVTDALSRLNEAVPVSLILNGWEPIGITDQYYGRHYYYGENARNPGRV